MSSLSLLSTEVKKRTGGVFAIGIALLSVSCASEPHRNTYYKIDPKSARPVTALAFVAQATPVDVGYYRLQSGRHQLTFKYKINRRTDELMAEIEASLTKKLGWTQFPNRYSAYPDFVNRSPGSAVLCRVGHIAPWKSNPPERGDEDSTFLSVLEVYDEAAPPAGRR